MLIRQELFKVLHGENTMRVDMEYVKEHQNVDKGKSVISLHSSSISKNERAGTFALDISGTAMDNKAYGGQGKTIEGVMQEALATDVAQQKDYMTVMSNSMSDEDFAKLQEDGYHPNSTEIGTLVTVVDRIKAELAESGVTISGYTDTLDWETWNAITGDSIKTQAIVSRLKKNDVPVTESNISEVKKALDKVQELSSIHEGAMKYMVQNNMSPTIDNIYTAEFSSISDGDHQGRGYYADEMPMYYAKKADDINIQQLMPQIEKVIEEANETVNTDTILAANWLIEKGVPLTSGTLSLLLDVSQTDVCINSDTIMDYITQAMGEGKSAGEALLLNKEGYYDQTKELLQEVEQISDEAIKAVVLSKQPITIKNLFAFQKQIQLQADDKTASMDSDESEISDNKLIVAKRQLEEIRLQMSLEANVKLLKKGIQIDTTELEQLVDYYKEIEKKHNSTLFGEYSDESSVIEKASLYRETLGKVSEIPAIPAAVIGRAVSQGIAFTLNNIYEQGIVLQNKYRAAEETYEALMTAPRSDLGDSIKKAFRNIDELLDDINMDHTETNKRAVRILGYNNMDITCENVEAIKEADETVTRVIRKATPAAVLQMIRDNRNPLETDLNSMEEYLSEMDADVLCESEKYSKYLYKLEQNDTISKEERKAYIGIYRLFHQIEKSDGAVIGRLVNQGAELSFKNLLTAVRSKKNSNIDRTIDDDFGRLESVNQDAESISDQINSIKAVAYNKRLVRDVLDNLEPEILDQIDITNEMTLEEIAWQIKTFDNENSQKIERQIEYQQLEDIRKIKNVEDSVIRTLIDFDQPVTVDNLMALSYMKQNRGAAFRSLYEKAEGEEKEVLEKTFTEVTKNFVGEEEVNMSFKNLEQVSKDIMETVSEKESVTSLDIRSLALTFTQVKLATDLAKEKYYEVPVMIGNQVTSINLRIVHGEESGKVTAITQGELCGKVVAEFTVNGDNISGYIGTDSQEGLTILKEKEAELKNGLQKNGKQISSLNLIYSQNLDTEKIVAEKNSRSEKEAVSSKELYTIAKEFLNFIQINDGNEREGATHETQL